MNTLSDQLGITIEKWETPRLIIEKTTKKDIDEISPFFLDRSVTQYVDLLPLHFRSIEDAKSYIEKDVGEDDLMYTIRLKETNEAIGQIGYYLYDENMSVFYWIGKQFQNNGYATEAAINFSNLVFEKSSIKTFAIYFHCASLPAVKVAQKLKDGLLKLHNEWSSSYTEREIEKYVVTEIDTQKVTVTKTSPKTSGDVETKINRCSFPDEFLSVGAKFELKCAYYIISKNKSFIE